MPHQFAQIAVDSIVSVADLQSKDVDFQMIKVHGKPGGEIPDSALVRSVVIDKNLLILICTSR